MPKRNAKRFQPIVLNARGRPLTIAEQEEDSSLFESTDTTAVTKAMPEFATLTLDDALADLKVGKKVWRRLRAELRVESELFSVVLAMWRRDARRVESAFLRELPAQIAQAAVNRVEEAAETCAAVEASLHPSQWSSVARQESVSAAHVSEGASQESRLPSLAGVQSRLPKMPLGSMPNSDNQEERRRALRRRLQFLLPSETLTFLKTASAELRASGAEGAEPYIQDIWSALAGRADAEELVAELICTQPDIALQRALRGVLPSTSENSSATQDAAQLPVKKTASISPEITCLPDPQIMQVISFISSAAELCSMGATSITIKELAEDDCFWASVWRRNRTSAFKVEPPASNVRLCLLSRRAACCVECRAVTEFEHTILGCRLCEQCEKEYPRYALIRGRTAMQVFQLPVTAMRSIAHYDGTTGRVYLRKAVEEIASRHHSREGLRQLRAKNVTGVSGSGRQNKRDQARGRGKADDDPCCFEATALRLATEFDDNVGR